MLERLRSGNDSWEEAFAEEWNVPEGVALELTIVLALILANGIFAAAEMALVSARRSVLQRRAEEGDAGARAALALVDAPNDFLATVQIGITFVGTFAGAFGGASAVRALAPWLRNLGLPLISSYAHSVALALVVLLITYLTLVVGELVPKRIALRDPDRLALRLARPMRRLARLTRPLVHLLGASTDALLHLLGYRTPRAEPETTEEIGYLLETGMRRGEIEPVEAELVEEVFRFTETRARDAMTPRPDMVALPDDATPEQVLRLSLTSGYSRIPIYHDTPDQVVGFIHARDLLGLCLGEETPPLADLLREPLYVPESITIAALLSRFRQERAHLAVVLDEFGLTSGIITLEDVLEQLVGEIEEEHRPEETPVVQRSPNSWLVDGAASLEDLRDTLPITEWPERDRLGYTTLAGFLLARLGHIPRRGEAVEWQGYRLEVIDMDGRRIDQVLVTALGE